MPMGPTSPPRASITHADEPTEPGTAPVDALTAM